MSNKLHGLGLHTFIEPNIRAINVRRVHVEHVHNISDSTQYPSMRTARPKMLRGRLKIWLGWAGLGEVQLIVTAKLQL